MLGPDAPFNAFLKVRFPQSIIKSMKVPVLTTLDAFLQGIKNLLSSKILLLIRLMAPQLFNNMELESGYLLNMIKKTSILAFSCSALFPSSPSNKKGSNSVLLKNCLPLELPDA
jgi:hypothetical protein